MMNAKDSGGKSTVTPSIRDANISAQEKNKFMRALRDYNNAGMMIRHFRQSRNAAKQTMCAVLAKSGSFKVVTNRTQIFYLQDGKVMIHNDSRQNNKVPK